jgi:FAD dependent oxidoreductase
VDIFASKSQSAATFDIIVAGSGSAGSTAAIAAARSGARTLLLERHPFLGGTSTCVLDTFYGFYTPGSQSRKVVGGIGDDVVAGLKQFNACIERPNTYGAGKGVTYNTEYLKVVWERLVRQSGCQVLLNVWVQDAVREHDRVTELLIATKEGLKRVQAAVFIDATGDGDVCHYAGAECELAGKEGPAQMLTTTFKVVNVDMARRKSVSTEEFHRRMAVAADSGAYSLPRREGSDHRTPIRGMLATNLTRMPSYSRKDGEFRNAINVELLTDAEIEGRLQSLEYLRFLKTEIAGYEEAELVAFATQVGVRESRRIYGDYRLTRQDVMEARQFEDQIALCGAPIEDHGEGGDTKWQYLPDGECVGIPFRTLLPAKVENLLVAGRCFSATHDAHASVRSMAQCMAMGQAAGTAAALATRRSIGLRELSGEDLREALRQNGAILKTSAQ